MEGNNIIELVSQYKYLIMIPLAIVEGPLLMMISGFLLRLQVLKLVPAYLALLAGDFLGDMIWYGVGYYWGKPFINRFGKFFSITKEAVDTVERIFHRHKDSILVISKITMGFGFALITLITAGLTHIPFRRYLLLNFVGQFIWTSVLMSLGYFFGNLYVSLADDFGKLSTIALFAVVFLSLFGVAKYIRGELIKKYS